MNQFIPNFLAKRAINENIEIDKYVKNAIEFLESTDHFVRVSEIENMDKIKSEPHWPIMHDMYERSYEYICGSLSLLIIGQYQSCEASCRTSIEGAVNLNFVSLGDSLGKIISYFKHHFEVERKQNVNWKSAVDKSRADKEALDYHRGLIINKNEALDVFEEVVRKSMLDVGVDINNFKAEWPSAFDRFRLINDEIGYRTIYVALCSQSHNDPEDLLNHHLCRTVDNKGFTSAKKEEQYYFSLYMVLQSINYYIKASSMYLDKFNIASEELPEKYLKMLDLIQQSQDDKDQILHEYTS